MLRADLTWAWPMLGWRIVTLASARLMASMRFPPLREVYQRGTCKGCDIQSSLEHLLFRGALACGLDLEINFHEL